MFCHRNYQIRATATSDIAAGKHVKWFQSTRLHGITSQKAVILIVTAFKK
jgi:hypothetical protein